ncbi:DUF6194 family protein [Gordonia soli]|uniref:DUF6194 domain-containing protein n=1 Tax=Gordonia soli NBRC 108243 TaxID=1223545 RepID=M0QQQ1_9ACTN|nr:DUF6194 family protein [Gordonia soli]GAC70888.1 hypothetical protein GS4_43_00140 [Gordonia soli NBRC 108243]
MNLYELMETVRSFDGVLELAPDEGSGFPEIAWGDHFFYYAPDGQIPAGQPYATVVTKDYPDEPSSGLDRPDRWRVNIHVGGARSAELLGGEPGDLAATTDFTRSDVVHPHPVYHRQGWIAVVCPGPATSDTVVALLRDAHRAAERRASKRRVESAGEGEG